MTMSMTDFQKVGVVSVMGLEGLEGLMIVEATMCENFRLDFGGRVRRLV